MKKQLTIIGIFLVALMLVAAVPICSGYSIELQEAIHVGNEVGYDHVKWYFEIEALSEKDISHVTVEVGQCYEIISAGPEPYEIGYDPTTGIDGVKWDVELEVGESAIYWFVTRAPDGETRYGDVESAIKAGQDVCRYMVDGPVCAPNAVTLTGLSAEARDIAILRGITLALLVGATAVLVMWFSERRRI